MYVQKIRKQLGMSIEFPLSCIRICETGKMVSQNIEPLEEEERKQ